VYEAGPLPVVGSERQAHVADCHPASAAARRDTLATRGDANEPHGTAMAALPGEAYP
jgi:hypothetical protein